MELFGYFQALQSSILPRYLVGEEYQAGDDEREAQDSEHDPPHDKAAGVS